MCPDLSYMTFFQEQLSFSVGDASEPWCKEPFVVHLFLPYEELWDFDFDFPSYRRIIWEDVV